MGAEAGLTEGVGSTGVAWSWHAREDLPGTREILPFPRAKSEVLPSEGRQSEEGRAAGSRSAS